MGGEQYKRFTHRACEYFPCHQGADPETFNCLFCYCPLYFLGENCGGNFTFTDSGIKDCSRCLVPHSPGGYEHVIGRLQAQARETSQRKSGSSSG